ncbi:isochorismatase [Cereibacter changlensis JA139]|uniref:Isochorismatase n=2 Tax=Cereibacter changlensis TaxID=402884 RepID=A0A2T4JYD5_9RHOB|nr:cysteine hydrolase family protein [Cereibacter changlensis]PTE22763.1 isochorismatase [Cereibacter changlensis JA139]PZX52362.1 nicotinamidase-related amidase [Cereibacter changlensis]
MTKTALLVIDMQMDMAFRIAEGQPHTGPDVPGRIAELLQLFRETGRPVLHVHHSEPEPGSPFHPDMPGAAPMPCALPQFHEPVFRKTTSSAFPSTDLEAHLRANGIDRLVICGAVAAFCVNSTTRSASDLGFAAIVVEDAVLGFGLPDRAGGMLPPETVLAVTLSALDLDFARVLPTARIAEALQPA